MLATVIVTLCLPTGVCVDKIVTEQATLAECAGPFALQVLPKWMEDSGYAARGYRMTRWGCTMGRRPVI